MPNQAQPGNWTRRQFVSGLAGMLVLPQLDSGSPASPAGGMLYVANNDALHQGLPRGTVDAFRVQPGGGSRTLVNRMPLSLSATHPRSVALSPDGKWLAVSAYTGGIYNLLPVAEDGSVGAPRGIFKETGAGAHSTLQASAHPHTLLFDQRGGSLLATDFGCDRLSVFTVEDGRLQRRTQHHTGAGSGPGACVLHPAGLLFVVHELGRSIASYRYDAVSGGISALGQTPANASTLSLHPSRPMILLSDGQSDTRRAWELDLRSGRLTPSAATFG